MGVVSQGAGGGGGGKGGLQTENGGSRGDDCIFSYQTRIYLKYEPSQLMNQ